MERLIGLEEWCDLDHNIICAVVTQWRTDIIYFDFAKAFDSVSHAKLVHKLQAYGITGRLLKLLSYFFCLIAFSVLFYQVEFLHTAQ